MLVDSEPNGKEERQNGGVVETWKRQNTRT